MMPTMQRHDDNSLAFQCRDGPIKMQPEERLKNTVLLMPARLAAGGNFLRKKFLTDLGFYIIVSASVDLTDS